MNKSDVVPAHSYEPEIFNCHSAEVIIPLLMDNFTINSVVDVGCGPGNWLAVVKDCGIGDYLGIDSEHVSPSELKIPNEHFMVANLEEFIPPDRKFDLCLSLEVAEHLSSEVADNFIAGLVSLSDIVLFSAAIPGQTGQHHVNLQWPEYWAEKFRKHGYRCSDFIRPLIWKDENVNWWYKQNILLFLSEKIKFDKCTEIPEKMVHPNQYIKVLSRLEKFQESAKRSTLKKIIDKLK